MNSSHPAQAKTQQTAELLREITDRVVAQKPRSAFSLTVTMSHSGDSVGAAINPFGLDTSCAEGYHTVAVVSTPVKKMTPPAGFAMHLWRVRDGITLQPILMIEVQDENTGNLFQKFNLEQKPLMVAEAATDEGPAIEAAVTKWITKWIKSIDKEIDHRMKTEGAKE